MQKSSHLGPSAGLALGHRDQATRDSGHQGSCDEGCLHAERFVQLLGSHAAEAEEKDARRKEHGLAQKRHVVWIWVVGEFFGQTYLQYLVNDPPGLQELLTGHTITNAPAEQGANVRQVAREMGGADGQGLASSGDAVLDTLRERKEQQALGSVVVAIAAMLLA